MVGASLLVPNGAVRSDRQHLFTPPALDLFSGEADHRGGRRDVKASRLSSFFFFPHSPQPDPYTDSREYRDEAQWKTEGIMGAGNPSD